MKRYQREFVTGKFRHLSRDSPQPPNSSKKTVMKIQSSNESSPSTSPQNILTKSVPNFTNINRPRSRPWSANMLLKGRNDHMTYKQNSNSHSLTKQFSEIVNFDNNNKQKLLSPQKSLITTPVEYEEPNNISSSSSSSIQKEKRKENFNSINTETITSSSKETISNEDEIIKNLGEGIKVTEIDEEQVQYYDPNLNKPISSLFEPINILSSQNESKQQLQQNQEKGEEEYLTPTKDKSIKSKSNTKTILTPEQYKSTISPLPQSQSQQQSFKNKQEIHLSTAYYSRLPSRFDNSENKPIYSTKTPQQNISVQNNHTPLKDENDINNYYNDIHKGLSPSYVDRFTPVHRQFDYYQWKLDYAEKEQQKINSDTPYLFSTNLNKSYQPKDLSPQFPSSPPPITKSNYMPNYIKWEEKTSPYDVPIKSTYQPTNLYSSYLLSNENPRNIKTPIPISDYGNITTNPTTYNIAGGSTYD